MSLARGQCDVASYAFIRFAASHGYHDLSIYTFDSQDIVERRFGNSNDKLNPEPKTYDVYGVRPDGTRWTRQNESGTSMCSWHVIVDAGHILIDFTARQYSKANAYPHIIAVEEQLIETLDAHTKRIRANNLASSAKAGA